MIGIIPRALREVFEVAKRHSQQKADTIRISVSYFEIYNDKVNDLADLTKQDLPIRQDSQNRIVISGLSEVRDLAFCIPYFMIEYSHSAIFRYQFPPCRSSKGSMKKNLAIEALHLRN